MKPSIPTIAAILLMIGSSACKPGESSHSSTTADHGWGENTNAAAILQALNEKLTDAYEREDVELLKDMLSDDHVHNNVFGSRLTKDEFLKDIESGTLVFESYETPEIEWYVTEDLAVATGEIEASAIRAGHPVPAKNFRFTRIFTKENGAWKVLLFQNAMIPANPGG